LRKNDNRVLRAYAYIDNLNEARKVLSDEVSSTLLTIAKDVKIQVEFNPAVVSEYRLIGYENRHLANEDFADDKVDAGEIGAGHTVTALYEIALVGSGGERNTGLRYDKLRRHSTELSNEIGELRLRYKDPSATNSKLIAQQLLVADIKDNTSDNFRFSAAVAGLGQYLRGGKYLNEYVLADIVALAETGSGADKFGYRREFINLVKLAEQLNTSRQAELQSDRSEPRG